MSCKTCGPGQVEGVQEINGTSQDPAYPVSSCGQGCVNPGLQPACCETTQAGGFVPIVAQGWGTPTLITPTNCSPVKACCTPPVCATPQPFYQTTQACTEDHSTTVINENFDASLNIVNSWNIPACGHSSIVSIPGLTDIVVGSYLWHPTYGYFQVLSFNPSNSQVTLQNNCNANNGAVGTPVPSCTGFVVTDSPASSSGGGDVPSIFPYLAIDFTAPANGTCVPITVTTTQGLSVGKNVQIGSATYGVSSISSATQMTICNNGLGAIPGTPVLAKDSGGNLQYPVILIDTNPCTNTLNAISGALIACSFNTQAPLTGAVAGMIPVLLNPATGEAQYKAIDFPTRTCTALSTCLTLAPGQTNTLLVVASTSQFIVGSVLQLGNSAVRLTVTSIVDATHMYADISPVPGAFVDYPIATSICIVDCCELAVTSVAIPAGACTGVGVGRMLTTFNKVGNVLNVASAPEHYAYNAATRGGGVFGSFINVAPLGLYTSPLPATTFTLVNPSACRVLITQVIVQLFYKLRISFTSINIVPTISINGAPATTLYTRELSVNVAEWTEDFLDTIAVPVAVPAGGNVTVTIQGVIETPTLGNTAPSHWSSFDCFMSATGSTTA